jgi:hypothetical protein
VAAKKATAPRARASEEADGDPAVVVPEQADGPGPDGPQTAQAAGPAPTGEAGTPVTGSAEPAVATTGTGPAGGVDSAGPVVTEPATELAAAGLAAAELAEPAAEGGVEPVETEPAVEPVGVEDHPGVGSVEPVAVGKSAQRTTGGVAPSASADEPSYEVEPPITAREPVLTAPSSRSWLARVPTNPGYAPELLALAAVETLGPRAREWAEQVRTAYPGATDDGLARLAVRRFTRLAAAGGTAAAVTGLLGPMAELATLAWAQAGLVLHLAAAHGVDPVDPERAVDLLVLTRVHPNAEVARTALAAAREQADEAPHSVQRATEAAWRLAAPLASQTAGWLAVRTLARLVPGSRLLVVGASGAAGAERLGHRAIAHYRGSAGTRPDREARV